MPDDPSRHAPGDEELLRRAAAGDRAAFGAIFERYQHRVYRFARAMTGSVQSAEDVTQEVFVVLIRDAGRYVAERAALSTYLYGIARNVSRDRARRERRFLAFRLGSAPTVTAADDPYGDIADAERNATIRRVLAGLPLSYREVVILCDLHDLSYADVAAVLRTSVAAVRSRLHRGRDLLRRRLRQAEQAGARTPADALKCSVGKVGAS
ncbi:MAG TPA: RNA polymerase sigma factor [Vicinamibacterales bacterium]|nr:RNA polymerase sigma factor [Vicinamibacterales bacterium]